MLWGMATRKRNKRPAYSGNAKADAMLQAAAERKALAARAAAAGREVWEQQEIEDHEHAAACAASLGFAAGLVAKVCDLDGDVPGALRMRCVQVAAELGIDYTAANAADRKAIQQLARERMGAR